MWTTQERMITATTVMSTSVGLVVGYVIAKKRLQPKYEAIAEQEIREAKVFYSKMEKPSSPTDLVKVTTKVEDEMTVKLEDLKETVHGLDYGNVEPGSEADHISAVESIHRHNGDQEDERSIFPDSASYTEEVTEEDRADREARRANVMPYVISVDEFLTGELNYEQMSLTYYEADDVLADDKDQPVPDPDVIVGDDNLTKFGWQSRDRNVVYMRNDRLSMDFEVIRHQGSFAEIVHGILQHDDRPGRGKIRKFRGLDE